MTVVFQSLSACLKLRFLFRLDPDSCCCHILTAVTVGLLEDCLTSRGLRNLLTCSRFELVSNFCQLRWTLQYRLNLPFIIAIICPIWRRLLQHARTHNYVSLFCNSKACVLYLTFRQDMEIRRSTKCTSPSHVASL